MKLIQGVVRSLGVGLTIVMVAFTTTVSGSNLIVKRRADLVQQLGQSEPLDISGFAGDVNVAPVKPGQDPQATVRAKWTLRKPKLAMQTGVSKQRVFLDCGNRLFRGWCGGDWSVEANPSQPLSIFGAFGDVKITDWKAATSVKSSAGDIKITGVHDDVKVRTGTGSVAIIDVEGDVDVRTSAGDVNIKGSDKGNITVKNSSGSIRLVLPDGEYQVITKVNAGQVTSDFPSTPGASRVIEVKTAAGDIEIVKAAER